MNTLQIPKRATSFTKVMLQCSVMLDLIVLTCSQLCLAEALNDRAEHPKLDKYLSTIAYPFETRAFKFASQGKDLQMVYMYLEPAPGQAIVTLLHGKNFNGMYWKTTAEMIHKQGFGVLIPDQIGFGKSSKPTDYQYSFAALARNTRSLLNHLGISESIVVGHSMGGMLAARFALMFPESSKRLVLINPIGLENYLAYVNYTDVDTLYQNELKKTPEKIISYQKRFYYDGDWSDEYQQHAEFLQGWTVGPDRVELAKISALTLDMIFTQPVIEEFDQLQVPTALILGTRDRTAPGRANKKQGVARELGRYDLLGAEVKARNKAIKVAELKDIGHLPHIEAFDRFKKAFFEAIE